MIGPGESLGNKERSVSEHAIPPSEIALSPAMPAPLFAGLDRAALALIQAHLTKEALPPGVIVCEENAPGDTLYIIQDGRVQVSKILEHGGEQVLREMGPGEFFGEIALLEDIPRLARVSTLAPTTLLAVTRQSFYALLQAHPLVATNFLKAIGRQLRLRYQEQALMLTEKQALVDALAAKNADLEHALAELRAALVTVAEHERVQRDLEIAHVIQQQMLPAAFPQAPGMRVHATTVPATWVGGDLYDTLLLEDGRVSMFLGDVSGKGISAAMQMARLMGEFRACVRHCAEPASVMHVLNDLLCQRNLRFSSFVTVQYLVLDTARRRVTFLCAGHPPILLRHANGGIEQLGAMPNIPLGIDETFRYHQEERQLMAGDMLLLYSDGTYERQDAQGTLFGLPRLSRLLTDAPPYPEVAIHAIQRALDAFSEVRGAHDDTTLLCVGVD